jgi:hypothetical protein
MRCLVGHTALVVAPRPSQLLRVGGASATGTLRQIFAQSQPYQQCPNELPRGQAATLLIDQLPYRSCVGADRNSADDQLGRAFEERADAFNLVVERPALRGGEGMQRLDRDRDSPARTALMPDPGDDAVDQ